MHVPSSRLGSFTVSDVWVAGAVILVAQQEVWFPVGALSYRSGPRDALAAAYLVAGLALLWSRRAPLPVLAVSASVLTLHGLVFGFPDGLGSLLPLLVALYAAARHCRRREFVAAALVTGTAFGVHIGFDSRYRDQPLTGLSLLPILVAVVAAIFGRVLRRRAESESRLTHVAEALAADRAEEMRAAMASERTRIARELHDLVGHGLSLTVVQAAAAAASLRHQDDDAALRRLSHVEDIARTTLEEVRRLVSLSSHGAAPCGPQPMIADLPALVDRVRAAGPRVVLDVASDLPRLPPGLQLAVYRIVQESLTNVVRHSARQVPVHVGIAAGARWVDVVVSDAGHGIATAITPGRGITGMQERAALYGGHLVVTDAPIGGLQVRAQFPLPEPSS